MAREKYTKYKKPGISWLGEIPEHWEIRRIKYVFKELDGKSTAGNEDLLSVSQYSGVTKKIDKIAEGENISNAKTLVGYKTVRKGDLVINIMLAWNGSLGISPYDGITSPAYCVYRLNQGNEKYFGYLFTTPNAKQEFKKQSTGIMDSRLRMYTDSFFNIKTALPPISEQTAISNFLDYKIEKIDRFITKKKQLIKLLTEQKVAIINKAVTKGINPNDILKPSGVEWLGDIPEHWVTIKLKFLSKITTGSKNTEDRVDNGEYDFYVRSQKVEKLNTYAYDGEGILTAGDGAGVGKVFHYANGKFDFHQRVYLFYNFSKNIDVLFLYNYLKQNLKVDLMLYNAKSTVDSVRLPTLKNFIVATPPYKEQKEIVSFIEIEKSKIDKTIATIEKELALVVEYKKALIAEAVTGKIDIRDFRIPVSTESLVSVEQDTN
jgi:type I restriction enzyme, S subunit